MEWISVKDRLPELGDEYLVVWDLKDGGKPIPTAMFFDGIKRYFYFDFAQDVNKNDEVLYWMPLPEVPNT